jgi:hypothetical protein
MQREATLQKLLAVREPKNKRILQAQLSLFFSDALKEEFPHADPNDPHSTWTAGALSRTDLLVSGVVAALAQFSKPKL